MVKPTLVGITHEQNTSIFCVNIFGFKSIYPRRILRQQTSVKNYFQSTF
jgi:hypothetical protein